MSLSFKVRRERKLASEPGLNQRAKNVDKPCGGTGEGNGHTDPGGLLEVPSSSWPGRRRASKREQDQVEGAAPLEAKARDARSAGEVAQPGGLPGVHWAWPWWRAAFTLR